MVKERQDQRIRNLEKHLEAKSEEHHALKRKNARDNSTMKNVLEDTRKKLDKALNERSEREQELQEERVRDRNRIAILKNEEVRLTESLRKVNLESQNKSSQVDDLRSSLTLTRNMVEDLKDFRTKAQKLDKRLKQSEQMNVDRGKSISTLEKKLSNVEKERDLALKNTEKLQANLNKTLQAMTKNTDGNQAQTLELRKEASRLQEQISKMQSGEAIMDADLQSALNLLKASLKPLSKADFASVTTDKRGVVIRLTADYLFEKGVIDLDPEVLPTLDQIADILARFDSKYVEVQGHTDDQALLNLPFIDNWALSSARADAVVRYFSTQTALPPQRLKSTACSQYRPLPESDAKHQRMNRRVEIILTSNP